MFARYNQRQEDSTRARSVFIRANVFADTVRVIPGFATQKVYAIHTVAEPVTSRERSMMRCYAGASWYHPSTASAGGVTLLMSRTTEYARARGGIDGEVRMMSSFGVIVTKRK